MSTTNIDLDMESYLAVLLSGIASSLSSISLSLGILAKREDYHE